jgi:predicted GNAT family acetyltransferase
MDDGVGRRVASATEFQALVSELLRADEARHTVMLGVLDALVRTPERYPESYLWVSERGGLAEAAALRTPPFHAVVAQPRSHEALEALVEAVLRDSPDLPGCNGARPEADDFAAAWVRRAGGSAREHMRLCLHRLEDLNDVRQAPGQVREAAAADRDLLISWMQAFADETGVQGGAEELARGIDAQLRLPLGLVVWEDGGRAVSLAGSRSTSPGVARVGPVYTPPDLRARGYATRLTWELTRALLERGEHTIVLFTDQANPTSNSIYRRIGYRPVCEAVELDFEAPRLGDS